MTEWAEAVGWEGLYEVSDDGGLTNHTDGSER